MTLARARDAELDAAGPEGAAALIWDDGPTVNGFEGLDMIRCGGVWPSHLTLHTQTQISAHMVSGGLSL
jgi:hypothetical protein